MCGTIREVVTQIAKLLTKAKMDSHAATSQTGYAGSIAPHNGAGDK
jgi:hypothetical protein